MAKIDARYQVSDGAYFKDPLTGKDLQVDMKRVVECKVTDEGKFVWPQVLLSNGEQVKIVYRYFTEQEKLLYKQYRDKGKVKQLAKSVESKPQVKLEIKEKNECKVAEVEQVENILFSDTGSKTTIAWIKAADKHLGVGYVDGVLCDTLWVSKENAYQYIPRCLIPYDERTRLNIPNTRS